MSIENLNGSRFNDVLRGNAANNVLSGLTGNDQAFGGPGNDRLFSEGGNDVLDGGTGSDTADYSTATAGVTVHVDLLFGDFPPGEPQDTGGAGLDTLVSIEHLTGSEFNDTLEVIGVDNSTLNGGNGNDLLETSHAVGSILNGEAGNDTLVWGNGFGTLNGGAGNDHLTDFDGGSVLNGGDGNDLLEAVENFFGDAILNGGAGADTLDAFGGPGSDFTFDYNAVTDSPAGTGRDRIIGFNAESNDQIDLTTIDANTLVAGNQAFIFGGAFTAGHLRYVGGVLQGNTDGDAAAEFEIQLVGAPALTVGGAGTDILL